MLRLPFSLIVIDQCGQLWLLLTLIVIDNCGLMTTVEFHYNQSMRTIMAIAFVECEQ